MIFTINNVVHAAERIKINETFWPPYFFPSANEDAGIGKEVLTQCINNAGYKTSYLNLPIKRTHVYVESGQVDMVVYSYKPERESFVYFGKEPIFDTEYGFVSKANSNIVINDLDDLSGLTIGYLAGLSLTPELLTIIDEKRLYDKVHEGFNIEDMFIQMTSPNPQFDVMPDAKATFYWIAKKMGISDKIQVLDYTIKHKPYYVTVSKKSKAIKDPQLFIQQIDDCIKTMKKDGSYQVILEKYGQLPMSSH